MPVITLFEHQKRSYRELGWEPADPVLTRLEQLSEAAGTDLLRLGRTYLHATQFVGVIQLGETTLQILPKIDYGSVGDADAGSDSMPFQTAVDSATRNLLYLLSYTHDLQVKEQDIAPLLAQRSSWFELLTRLLAVELNRQMKQGLQRDYVSFEDTLPVMRGRWQLDRQLTRRPHVRHQFDVAYDEFSPDMILNQVFRYVVERLRFLSQEPGNRRLLRNISKWLVDIERLGEVTQACLEAVHFTRLNRRFQPSFNLARLFLENQTFQLMTGKDRTFAFVFDMNRLFEEFVYRFIVRHRRRILTNGWGQVRPRYQAKGRPIYLAEKVPSGKAVFRLEPDILFTRPSGRAVLVLDTKYKELAQGQHRLGIAEGDMYQMLAYAVALDCPRTLLLYPQRAGSLPMSARFETLGHPHSVMVATINLRQRLDRPEGMIQEFREVFMEVSGYEPSAQV
jgi:5-methylcytosine-specific restriction enzyme subunit McrC